jgi:hypothetical protein
MFQCSTRTITDRFALACGLPNRLLSTVRKQNPIQLRNAHSTTVSFSTSQGHLAIVIYEWTDNSYLGKVTSESDESLPVIERFIFSVLNMCLQSTSQQKTYICTSDAVKGGFCSPDDLGRFIFDFPKGTSINNTSFWSAVVDLTPRPPVVHRPVVGPMARSLSEEVTPLFRHRRVEHDMSTTLNPSPSGVLRYQQPIQYHVRKTGYYCVGQLCVFLHL